MEVVNNMWNIAYCTMELPPGIKVIWEGPWWKHDSHYHWLIDIGGKYGMSLIHNNATGNYGIAPVQIRGDHTPYSTGCPAYDLLPGEVYPYSRVEGYDLVNEMRRKLIKDYRIK